MPERPPAADRPEVALAGISEPDLVPLAARLIASLPRPAFVALHGDLGAGKTTFVKALATAAGIDPAGVTSPTFGLVHEHAAPGGLFLHADVYRLADVDELLEIGWQDAVSRATWAVVEWPERIAAALPADRLDVLIEIDSPTSRTLRFAGQGPAHAAAVAAVRG